MQNKKLSADPNGSLPHSQIEQVYDLRVSSTTQAPNASFSWKNEHGNSDSLYFVT